MYLFELENPHTGEKAEIRVPEEMRKPSNQSPMTNKST